MKSTALLRNWMAGQTDPWSFWTVELANSLCWWTAEQTD